MMPPFWSDVMLFPGVGVGRGEGGVIVRYVWMDGVVRLGQCSACRFPFSIAPHHHPSRDDTRSFTHRRSRTWCYQKSLQ